MAVNLEGSHTIGHMVVVAGDYPAPGHMMLVFVQQLVNAMLMQGVIISVVAPQSIVHALVHKDKLLPRRSSVTLADGKSYIVYRPYVLSFGKYGILQKLANKLNAFFVRGKLKKIKPDTLYSHFWSSAQLVSDYALNNNIPLFVACGEGDNALEDMVQTYSTYELSKLANAVKGVISVSSDNKRKCIEYNLAKEEDIEVFPNCVDTNSFKRKNSTFLKNQLGIKDDDFVIAFVGGFISRKGPDRLAEAIKLINDSSMKVLFIGKSFPGYPFEFDCPGIVFKGPVDHDLLPLYLSCADVFVLPTQKEGCCNAIVEALAIGLPVISSDRAFNDDILDDKNSIRINPNSIRDIADAILELRNNEGKRKEMSAISLSRHDSYSVEARAQKILRFIFRKIYK